MTNNLYMYTYMYFGSGYLEFEIYHYAIFVLWESMVDNLHHCHCNILLYLGWVLKLLDF